VKALVVIAFVILCMLVGAACYALVVYVTQERKRENPKDEMRWYR
jgi:hypothetical protein